MKKKAVAVMLSIALSAAMLVGCGGNGSAEVVGDTTAVEEPGQSEDADEAEDQEVADAAQQEEDEADNEESQDVAAEAEDDYEAVDVKIGSLKGPTSMGLVYLMDQAEKNEAANNYEFKMVATADELLPSMISGDLDIVLVPANVASVLYNKTEGAVSVIDINTLGVLYIVSGDDTIQSMEDYH